MNRRQFLSVSAKTVGGLGFALYLPRAIAQQSGVGQTLPLDVPARLLDAVASRPTDQSITISLLSYRDSEVYIAYGTTQTGLSKTNPILLSKNQPFELLLENLQKNTQYQYQIYAREVGASTFVPLNQRTFHTQRSRGETFTFVIQADSHLDANCSLEVYSRTLQNQLADQPDFMIDMGDTFMTDKYQPFASAEVQHLAQRYFFGFLAPIPLFLMLGNHDAEGVKGGNTGADMGTWALSTRKKYFPNPEPNSFYTGNTTPHATAGLLQNYYAFEWGDMLIVVLDPYWYTTRNPNDNWGASLGEAQYKWLGTTLENSTAKWKMVFIHQLVGGLTSSGRGGIEAAPFFEWGGRNQDGSNGFNKYRPNWAMPIHQLLVKNRVRAVFHGHDHMFIQQELDGIVYQLLPQPASARFGSVNNAKEYGYLTGNIIGSPGHLRVQVSSQELTVEYVRSYLPKDETASRKNAQVDFKYSLKAEN